MIEVAELIKDYGPARALHSISFRVEPGEIVGFLGPNGAGKSTTLRILSGYMPATRGSASIAGIDVFRNSLAARERMGYLPENVPLYPELRVREYLRFRGRLKGVSRSKLKARMEEVISQCGLSEMAGKTIGALSRGYRQRVGLADALIAQPPVLILDEPTTGLDPNQRSEIKKLVQSLSPNQTILFSSHILPEVESICRRVLMIHRGRIVADGTPQELIEKLGAAHQFRVELTAPGIESEALILECQSLPGVSKAWVESRENEQIQLRLEANPGADPRKEIFELAKHRGWSLLELGRARLSLEEIFARLTAS